MFATHSSDRLHTPGSLLLPEQSYWRAMALTAHRAWLLATFRVRDGKAEFRQTLCFGCGSDLLERVRAVPVEPLDALVFMAPPWQTQRGQWASHNVTAIWSASSTAGGPDMLVFDTDAGNCLVADPACDPADRVQKLELLLRIPSCGRTL
ncbi:hypothetical protein ACG0Z6_12755 [Roseateles sp. BYS180W]|uniref:Uncharacterized protein n=1 Tax=Roseateles rivi TaxID=3299028 RepID=A0ABW7FXQ2_9BURK